MSTNIAAVENGDHKRFDPLSPHMLKYGKRSNNPQVVSLILIISPLFLCVEDALIRVATTYNVWNFI